MRQLTYVKDTTIEWWAARRLQNDHDALVMQLAVTRCDLAIASGWSGLPGPFALGHESAGRVMDIGDCVRNFVPGDLVIVSFQIKACGVEYGGGLSDLIRVPFADPMLVRHPQGHPLSQTAGPADGATDAFSAVTHWFRQRPGKEMLVIALANACTTISPKLRRCRYGTCMAWGSPFESAASAFVPNCLNASITSQTGLSIPNRSLGASASRMLMRQSATPPIRVAFVRDGIE